MPLVGRRYPTEWKGRRSLGAHDLIWVFAFDAATGANRHRFGQGAWPSTNIFASCPVPVHQIRGFVVSSNGESPELD